jgi:hypothetical protein
MKIVKDYLDISNPSNYGHDMEIPSVELAEKLDEAIDLLAKYDKYIIDFMEVHGTCMDGCCPVCVDEFFSNEYQEN